MTAVVTLIYMIFQQIAIKTDMLTVVTQNVLIHSFEM